MNNITLVWFVCLIGVVALAAVYWRYTSRATSSLSIRSFEIEDLIFAAQVLFVVWLAFRETFHLIVMYVNSGPIW